MTLELHDFTLEEIGKYKKQSGIYALIYNDEVIYVGQSKDVKHRLQYHRNCEYALKTAKKIYKEAEEKYKPGKIHAIKLYEFLVENKENIKFLVLPTDVDKLNEFEELYITKHQPKFNYSGVKARYLPYKRRR